MDEITDFIISKIRLEKAIKKNENAHWEHTKRPHPKTRAKISTTKEEVTELIKWINEGFEE